MSETLEQIPTEETGGEKLKPVDIRPEQTVTLDRETVEGLKLTSDGTMPEESIGSLLVDKCATSENVGSFTENSGFIAYIPRVGEYSLVPATRENKTALELAGYRPTSSIDVIARADMDSSIEGNELVHAKIEHMKNVLRADDSAAEVERISRIR